MRPKPTPACLHNAILSASSEPNQSHDAVLWNAISTWLFDARPIAWPGPQVPAASRQQPLKPRFAKANPISPPPDQIVQSSPFGVKLSLAGPFRAYQRSFDAVKTFPSCMRHTSHFCIAEQPHWLQVESHSYLLNADRVQMAFWSHNGLEQALGWIISRCDGVHVYA